MAASEASTIKGLIEVAKLGLASYFQAMKLAGKTDEEIAQEYKVERAKFIMNDPTKLKDV